jgi:RNA polymerase sigma factor (sigma-70 family)
MPTGHASLMPTLRRVVLAGTTADRTDGQLLGAFVTDRDADAFGALVRRHGPMVLGVCRRLLADHATADDAFQAVFLVLARRAAAVRPRERVGNWLYGVAYRTALKARAALARRRSREKQVPVMPEPPAAPPRDEWADLRPVLDEELAALPEKLRTPVVLCDLEGRPQREVARALGLPPATLATRLAAARRTLAQRLTRRGVTLPGGVLAALLAAHGASAAVPAGLARALTRAAGAVASGAAYSELVSAGALHLSEGVMRMMTLSKLKALAVAAAVTAALTGGLGLGLAPARGQAPGDAPRPVLRGAAADRPADTPPPAPQPPAAADDITFLRRVCLDLRGTPPTKIETFFFASDADAQKRTKLVNWLLADAGTLAFVQDRLATPVVRYHVRPVKDVKGSEADRIVVLFEATKPVPHVRVLALGADGSPLADAPPAETVRELLFVRDDQAATRVVAWDAVEAEDDPEAPKPHRAFGLKLEDLRKLIDEKNPSRAGPAPPPGAQPLQYDYAAPQAFVVTDGESDLTFLKRVTTAARGTPPTGLEERYFTEDTDPKKREKLLDSLLKEPAVAKRLGDDFKAKMLAAVPRDVLRIRPSTLYYNLVPQSDGKPAAPRPPQPPVWKFEKSFQFDVPPGGVLPEFRFEKTIPLYWTDDGKPFAAPVPPTPKASAEPASPRVAPKLPAPPAARGDRLGKLIDELLAANKSDAEVLEAVTLATAGRLPTETEKRLMLALVAKTADRRAAWLGAVKALVAPGEGGVEWEFHVAPATPAPPKAP